MSQVHYMLCEYDDQAVVTAFIPGAERPLTADSTHPNFDRIVAGLKADDPEVVELFDASEAVSARFENLSERVAVLNGHVYFDGDEVDNTITRQIVRFLEEDVADWEPLVNFMENVASNPQEHSREQLYRWLETRNFTITPEGNFVAYKGVRVTDGVPRSINAGPGIVNGEKVTGHLDNSIGNIVEIARSYVNHDPSQGCSTGLHVGTFDYAHSFGGGNTLKVTVNPRDVVSVPTDCGDQKVRVCRYQVEDFTSAPVTSAFDYDSCEDEDWYDEDDWEDEADFDEPSVAQTATSFS